MPRYRCPRELVLPNIANTTWSADYRADNLRAWTQASSTSTPSGRVYYYYDGGNAVLERSPTGHTYSINVFAPDGLVARNYTPPPVSSGPEEEEVEEMVGAAYRGDYLFDWQGNATHIICPPSVGPGGNPTATLIHSAYNAWGQKNFLYPSNFNAELHRFGYNARWGYRTDTETGLVYCQNRYYDPANGRWVTRDPIGYAGGINLYGYCGSGPVGTADPRGLDRIAVIWYPVPFDGSLGNHAGLVFMPDNSDTPYHSIAAGPEQYGAYGNGNVKDRSGPWGRGTQDFDEMKKYNLIDAQGKLREEANCMVLAQGPYCTPDYMTCWGTQTHPYFFWPELAIFREQFDDVEEHDWRNSNSFLYTVLLQNGLLDEFYCAGAKRGGWPWSPGWGLQMK